MIVPGSRAGRAFLNRMLEQDDASAAVVAPPSVLTPGHLDTIIPDPPHPSRDLIPARPEEATIAWLHTLRNHHAPQGDATDRAFFEAPLDDGTPLPWRPLADRFRRAINELSGERTTCSAIADHLRTRARLGEAARWSTFQLMADAVAVRLEQRGRFDLDQFRATIDDDAFAAPDPAIRTIVLSGITDLNRLQRARLNAALRAGVHVVALVHAPEEHQDRYDELGCVRPDAWTHLEVDIPDDAIHLCESFTDQPDAALRIGAGRQVEFGDAMTIGVADPALIPGLRRVASWHDAHVHSGEGIAFESTIPGRLLQALAPWLQDGRFLDFATLLRHPDVHHWVATQDAASSEEPEPDWTAVLDRYYTDTLHGRLTDDWLGPRSRHAARLRIAHDLVRAWLEPLRGPERALNEWMDPLLEVLRTLATGESAPPHSAETDAAYDQVAGVARELSLSDCSALGPVPAAVAIRWIGAALQREHVPVEPRAESIETPGWLELVHDPSPSLMIVGLNDGIIPQVVDGDPLLPNSMRVELGLASNERRFARDLCLFDMLVRTRRSVDVICTRHDADDQLLLPSRILLACSRETQRARLRRFTDGQDLEPAARLPMSPRAGHDSAFVVPPLPDPVPTCDSMSVTAFRDYLNCPYRFALRHLLRLEPVTDDGREMDALAFGNLAHDVLQRFGEDSSIHDSTDLEAIEAWLIRETQSISRAIYGGNPSPALRVQILQLERRWKTVAAVQARTRADGWRILHTEKNLKDAAPLTIPGQDPMPIRGRIDRIDVRETGAVREYRILDYKTGSVKDDPEKQHYVACKETGERTWSDLQLPLYHALAVPMLSLAPETQVGYFVIAKDEASIEIKASSWEKNVLEDAVECARQVVRDIRDGHFEPNPDARYWRDFARILREGVRGGASEDDAAS